MHLGFGTNHMLKGNSVHGCETGLDIRYPGTAVVEDTTVEGAKRAVFFMHGNVQLTGLQVSKPAKDGVAVRYEEAGLLTLVNCNVAPTQVDMASLKPLQDKEQTARIVAMYYLVAAAKGAAADAQVDVRTVNPMPPLPLNAVDLNIRNAPATVTDGLTPLPQSLGALIVKGWSVDIEGKPIAAPEYDLRLLAPVDKPGAERKVLGALKVKPQESWYRVKPNETTPTPEVLFK
jgi:hypothetical protein